MSTQSLREHFRQSGGSGSPPSLDERLMVGFTAELRAKRRAEEIPPHRRRSRADVLIREGLASADRHLEAFLHHPSTPVLEGGMLPEENIESWFDGLESDADEAGIAMPSMDVVAEAKRIVLGLNGYLPSNTDVYTLEEGKVVVEVFGSTGRGLQLICEPNGGALCLVTVDKASRRARYESSAILPDGFLKEGLRAVRPVG